MNKQTQGEINPQELALKLLSRRAYSRGALLEKLEQKGIAQEDARTTADWLEELGLLNDAAYACDLVQHYSQQGYGLYKAKEELRRHKVPQELWEQALEELGDPARAIDDFLGRRLEPNAQPKQIQKCYDALVRRGFPHQAIKEGLNRYHVITDE